MLVETFYHIDNLCKIFEELIAKYSIELSNKKQRKYEQSMSLSEIATIRIYYHYSGYQTFKSYYTKHVLIHMKSDFKKLVSYNRFIELTKQMIIPMTLFLELSFAKKCTGISYIDSSSLSVCHNKRIYSHKVFNTIAQRGKTSMGWFYGFKIHLVINQYGEIVNFSFTPGNIADIATLV